MALIIQAQPKISGVDAALNPRYVYLISAIAALGGVLFGFDLVIISGTVPFFTRHFDLNEFETGWAVGCINLGAAIGALLGGKLSDSLGRKKLLMGCAVLFALTDAEASFDAANRSRAVKEMLTEAQSPVLLGMADKATTEAVARTFALPFAAAGIDAKVVVHIAGQG